MTRDPALVLSREECAALMGLLNESGAIRVLKIQEKLCPTMIGIHPGHDVIARVSCAAEGCAGCCDE